MLDLTRCLVTGVYLSQTMMEVSHVYNCFPGKCYHELGFVQMAQSMKKEKQSLQAPPDIKRHVYLI